MHRPRVTKVDVVMTIISAMIEAALVVKFASRLWDPERVAHRRG